MGPLRFCGLSYTVLAQLRPVSYIKFSTQHNTMILSVLFTEHQFIGYESVSFLISLLRLAISLPSISYSFSLLRRN